MSEMIAFGTSLMFLGGGIIVGVVSSTAIGGMETIGFGVLWISFGFLVPFMSGLHAAKMEVEQR